MFGKDDDTGLPSRQETRQIMVDLIARARTRQEVASWAATYVVNDPPEVDNWVVWDALETLMAADLLSLTDAYELSVTDFQHLLEEFDSNSPSIK